MILHKINVLNIKHPVYLILFFFLTSCASFDKDVSSITSLNELNGKYEVIPVVYDSISNNHLDYKYTYRNLFTLLDYRSKKKEVQLHTTNNSLELNIIDDKHTQIAYLVNGIIIEQYIVKTKFKKDGYLYFKKRKIKVKGVPYIFGRFNFIKTRLTLDESNLLKIDISDYSTGAGLLIISLHFEKDIISEKFRKVN